MLPEIIPRPVTEVMDNTFTSITVSNTNRILKYHIIFHIHPELSNHIKIFRDILEKVRISRIICIPLDEENDD